MPTILLIEDDARVASLIKRGLEEQQFAVDQAFDGETGKLLAGSNDYAVIIMDIMLPDSSGLDICKQVKITKPDTPVIMLTALGNTDDKLEGFDAGADDYLVKPFDIRELHARIKVLAKRNKAAVGAQDVISIADLELNRRTKLVKRSGREISLTNKEFRLLQYMMENSGQVLSRVEIAEKVWETFFDTGTNFIDVYINYLRKKIDKDFPVKLIHTKPGMGFIFKDETAL